MEFSWGKNDYIFVRFWAIWGLYCGVATYGYIIDAIWAHERVVVSLRALGEAEPEQLHEVGLESSRSVARISDLQV